MKKSLIIALGAIALVACTKTSVSYEQTGEIGFAPVVRKNSTKAAVEGTEFPNQNIKVFGYYDNSMAVGSSYSAGKFAVEYLPGVEFAKNVPFGLAQIIIIIIGLRPVPFFSQVILLLILVL